MSVRGRKLGQFQNARDARGWMIPRDGTKRRAVYDAMVAGMSDQQIRADLAMSGRNVLASHKAYIQRWRRVQQWRNAAAIEMRAP